MNARHLALACRLADVARDIALRHYRSVTDFSDKADHTPVTAADREIEATVREILAAEVPQHGVLGEETGAYKLEEEFVWVIDPIDGTKAFVTGKPLFGVLISLVHRATPVLGIIDQPVLKERWIGMVGERTTLNGRPVSVRRERPLREALCYTANPEMFSDDLLGGFAGLKRNVKWLLYNCDCYAYGLLAAGYVDVVFERNLGPHDFCALAPIIEGASGHISDFAGRPLRLDSDGTVIAATGDSLAREVAALLTQSSAGT